MTPIERISVIGAGLMGHAIALEFAIGGFPVRVYDPSSERVADARARAALTARPLVSGGLLSEADLAAALTRLEPTSSLAEACGDADYVAEAVPEDLAMKRAVYAEMDRLCPPRTIFASNTSSLPPTQLGAVTDRADRVLVAHYFTPPHLIPVVELVLGQHTRPEIADTVAVLLRKIGKTPALVRRETPGFIANRLQAALLREAIALVEQGVADAEDIDAVVRLGFGRRLAVFGPFAVSDLAGLDVWAAICDLLFPTLDASQSTPTLLKERVEAGHFGAKSGEGFYPWPAERLSAALATRDAELLRRLIADASQQ